ncbi:MAG: acyl-CoA carboxylase subunit epsilon [Nocardioidaceae bacterium]|nr:acyl-CoA carboxylase subunit epsilon [Nocardioidaceae bacterium]
MPDQEQALPLLKVLKGDPTPEELAALVAVVAARVAAGGDERTVVRRSSWPARERNMRGAHHHGPGRWRASAFPR